VTLVVQIADQSGVAVFQQIQVTRCALDISERCRIGRFQEFMPPAAYQYEAEISEQFFVMLLADAEEVHHLAIEIVQYFDLRRVLAEENLRAAGKRFNICFVFRKYRDNLIGNRTLTADVR
jgi:hypothetical protein